MSMKLSLGDFSYVSLFFQPNYYLFADRKQQFDQLCDKVCNEPKERQTRDKNETLAAAKSEGRSMQVRKCRKPKGKKNYNKAQHQRNWEMFLFQSQKE